MVWQIAVQPDRVLHKNGEIQSYSDRWRERAAEYGVRVEEFDAYRPGAITKLAGFDGFMWRVPPDADVRRFSQAFLSAAERCSETLVYPDWNTRWHMEDKIAQSYALEGLGVPIPRTHIVWRYEEAIEYSRRASYPLVLKLASGYQSSNVRLLRDPGEARYFINKLFRSGLGSLAFTRAGPVRETARRLRQVCQSIGGAQWDVTSENEWHKGYAYLQEFIAGNEYDTRVTVIGNRAFGFVRGNREDDFRASGSGLLDWNPNRIDPRTIEVAFRVAVGLGTQVVAIDTLERDGEVVVLELSLAFASWAVGRCPGHWRLVSLDPYKIEWVRGHLKPEDAIFDDFVASMRDRGGG